MEANLEKIYSFIIDKEDFDSLKDNIKQIIVGNYGGVILVIKNNNFEISNIPILIELFTQKQLVVIGVKSDNKDIQEFAKFSNLAIFTQNQVDEKETFSQQPLIYTKPSIIRGNTSKNEQLYAKQTDIILLDDLSKTSEVMSDKSIYIYGGAYGKIFAGINNDKAIIFINYFQAQLICINGVYKIFDKTPEHLLNKTLFISLKNNKLDFEIL